VTPARLRPSADADLLRASLHYRSVGGYDLADRFIDAAQTSLRSIEKTPGLGSPRIGELCDAPGLRVRRVKGFAYAWFYFVRADDLDVVRMLGEAQDLVSILASIESR
jgi:toxin ParE1/3/4